jgi:hypothetical protein
MRSASGDGTACPACSRSSVATVARMVATPKATRPLRESALRTGITTTTAGRSTALGMGRLMVTVRWSKGHGGGRVSRGGAAVMRAFTAITIDDNGVLPYRRRGAENRFPCIRDLGTKHAYCTMIYIISYFHLNHHTVSTVDPKLQAHQPTVLGNGRCLTAQASAVVAAGCQRG